MDFGGLALFAIVMAVVNQPNGPAKQAAISAYTKHTGIEAELDRLQRQNLPPELTASVGRITFVAHTVMEHRVTVKFTFP